MTEVTNMNAPLSTSGTETAVTVTMPIEPEAPGPPTPVAPTYDHDDANVNRLLQLYRHGGDLEMGFERMGRRDTSALLDEAQINAFNAIVRDARAYVPKSIALREDVAEIGAGGMRAIDAHRALRITILPALHNALPEELQSR